LLLRATLIAVKPIIARMLGRLFLLGSCWAITSSAASPRATVAATRATEIALPNATMLHTQVKGLSIAYQRAGSGPGFVLLHGFTLDSRSWRPQIDGLLDRFTVIAWDAPGAGQSDDPPGTFGIGDWAHALAGVLDSAGIQRAHVVGLSWGGLLAQEFYRRYPSYVVSLVLADTYAGWKGSLPAPLPEQRLDAAIKDSLLPPGEFVQKYLPGSSATLAAPEIRKELGDIMAEFHPAGFRLKAAM